MSRTTINVSAAGSANNTILKAKRSVTSAKNAFRSTSNNVDSKIKNRNNINSRLNSIQNQLCDIEWELSRISQTVQGGLQMYRSTDDRIEQKSSDIQRNAVEVKKSFYYDFFNNNDGNNKETGKIKKRSVLFEDISNDIKRRVKEILNGGKDSAGRRVSPENIKKLFQSIWKDEFGIGDFFEFTTGAKNLTGINLTSSVLDNVINSVLDNNENEKHFSDYFSSFSGIADFVGKKIDSDKMSFAGSALGYIGNLVGVFEAKNDTVSKKTSSVLSLLKSSIGVETGLFDYFEKSLHPYDSLKLDAKFGKTMSKLNIAGGIIGVADSLVDGIDVFNNPESNGYNKTASGIRVGSSFLKLGEDCWVSSLVDSKVLQVVSSAGKNSKVKNQILAENLNLAYGYDKVTKTKIKNVGSYITIATSVMDGIANGVDQYGVVTADGDFDWGDAGSVLTHFSTEGLSSMASSLTFGLVDVDGKSVANHLEADAKEFAQGDSWAAKYIRNENNWGPARFTVAIGSGAYIIGENVCETVGGWLTDAWDAVSGWF